MYSLSKVLEQKKFVTHAVTASATAIIAIVSFMTFFSAESEPKQEIDVIIITPVDLSGIISSNLPKGPLSESERKRLEKLEELQEIFDNSDNISRDLVYISSEYLTEKREDAENWEFVGDELFKARDYISAIGHYGKANELESGNARILSKLGMMYFIGNSDDLSLKYYDQALDANKNYIPALSNAAFLHAKKGNNELAEKYFQRALMIDNTFLPLLNNLALYQALRGNYEESIQVFDKIEKLAPNQTQYKENKQLIMLLNVQGKLKQTNNIMKNINEIKVNLNHSVALFLEGKIFQYQSDISFSGNFTEIENLLHYGGLSVDSKLYGSAEWYYKNVIIKDPVNVVALTGLGYTFENSQRLDEAIKYYERVLEIQPNYFAAWIGLGNVYAEKGSYNKALEHYNYVLKLEPSFPNAIIGLGNIELKKGNYDNAITYYDEVLIDNPDHILANKAKGFGFMKKNECIKAEKFYNTVLENKKEDYDALWGIGTCLYLKGERASAEEYFSRASNIQRNLTKPLEEIRYNINDTKTIEELEKNLSELEK